jgi:hypothetical protein
MDDAERTKAGLRDVYRRLLDLDFDRLLLAHGDPIVHGAKDELFAFVERGWRSRRLRAARRRVPNAA